MRVKFKITEEIRKQNFVFPCSNSSFQELYKTISSSLSDSVYSYKLLTNNVLNDGFFFQETRFLMVDV